MKTDFENVKQSIEGARAAEQFLRACAIELPRGGEVYETVTRHARPSSAGSEFFLRAYLRRLQKNIEVHATSESTLDRDRKAQHGTI
ncbi:hypothetical protein ACFQUU_16440 [Herbaspirillum sp. GCM10030257]|uniref:hypothetical protein n=1 Tax=Herbaspirillum sp. GCM10030257 TaxID=3273393 RepID=UPI0036139126